MESTTNAAAANEQTRRSVVAWVKDRLNRRNENGSVLIEAIVFMGIIGMAVAAYTASNATMQNVQRTATATDIVAQQAQSVLQASQSLPWDRLGFNPATQPGDSTYRDEFTVHHNQTASPTDDVTPTKTVERGGVAMTQTTYVTWDECGPVACTAGTSSAAYGTKRITVVITYQPRGRSKTRHATYSALRTSVPAEAVASTTIPAAEGPDGSEY